MKYQNDYDEPRLDVGSSDPGLNDILTSVETLSLELILRFASGTAYGLFVYHVERG